MFKVKTSIRYITVNVFYTLASLACSAQSFVQVAGSAGITGGYGTPNSSDAGGVSFVDFNNDGWDDLTFCNENAQALKIYQNNGDGTFQLMSMPGITGTNEKKTVMWIDFDNDGDQDLYVVFKPQHNRLFQNNGNGTFSDITAAAGLPVYPPTPDFWRPNNSAAFCDYDRDGDLDFYVSRYWMPSSPIDTNSFYRNNGNGTFTDVTSITGTQNGMRQSFCSTFFDYNNDGWEDLYVVNDRYLYENSLYKNNGNGTFADVSAASGTNVAVDAMNAGIGDYDHNGYLDIYVTNSGPTEQGPNFLFANQGNGTFVDKAAFSGTQFDRYGWAGNFFDFDHDLDLDLYVCASNETFEEPNAFYVNQGNGIYTEPFLNSGGLNGIDTVRSLTNVIGDFNNDGLPDIAVCNSGSYEFHLWENVTVTTHHWFKLLLVGTHANRDAIGAWTEMWISGQKYISSVMSHDGYCGQNTRRRIMSTGTHTSIDSLVIKWPIKVGNVPFHKQVIPGSQIVMSAVNTITEPVICHMVTSPLNDGLGSLRAAVNCAQPGDTIRIMLIPHDTIALTGGTIVIGKNLVIQSVNNLIQPIKAPLTGPAFTVSTGKQLNLKKIFLSGAQTVIENHGTLLLNGTSLKKTSISSAPLILNQGEARMFSSVGFHQ